MFIRILAPLLVGLALIFALASCAKKKEKPAYSWGSEIRLEDAQESGCLNLPKLFAALKRLDPERTATLVPVAIAFESQSEIRENFRRLLALAQLGVRHQSVSALQNLPAVRQAGCDKVTVIYDSGVEKGFVVRTSATDTLMAEAEDGERLDYQWISPRTLLSKHRYTVFDLPCSASNIPIIVTVTKVIDWSGSVPNLVPSSGSPYSIDKAFLDLAVSAVGESALSVYSGGMVDLEKVSAISARSSSSSRRQSLGNAAPIWA